MAARAPDYYRCPALGQGEPHMPYRDTALRKRCESILSTLRLPDPFSVPGLCRRLGEQRRRPIHLHPLPIHLAKAGACGLWLSTDTDDHIFYEQRTSHLHQEHIVLHEIGHLLFGHHSVDEDDSWITELLTDLDPRMIRNILGRSDYSTRQEQEAEMIASLIRTSASTTTRATRTRATRTRPTTATIAGDQPTDTLARLQDGLGLGAVRDG